MFRLACCCLLGLVSIARAQPAPAGPYYPPNHSGAWSPVDATGWPRSHSMETLRALDTCADGELAAVAGQPVACRPRPNVGPAHLAFGLDWTTGISGDERTTGAAHGLGFEGNFALTRALQLGARYELLGLGDRRGVETRMAHQVLGQLKYRAWTDEVDRDAITLGVGAGYAFRDALLGGTAPLARASLAREIGLYLDDNNAMTLGFELAYERTLDATAADAILASIRGGFELNIREPANLGTQDEAGRRQLTLAGDLYVGPYLGLGATLGLYATPWLSLQTSGSYLFGLTDEDSKLHAYDNATWTALTGPRIALRSAHAIAPYAQLQAGAAWYADADTPNLRYLAQPEVGARLQICEGAVEFGLWMRNDLEDRWAAVAGGLVLRLAMGDVRHGATRCGGGWSTPTYASPPPPPMPAYTPPQADVQVQVPDLSVGGQVQVEVPVVEVQPVTVEVTLGAALLGGMVQVRIDPRLLPLAQLRGAARIEVELRGPSSVLRSYQAQLDATVGQHGARIDTWATVPTGDASVTAKFTIWPPGSRR